MKIMDIQSFKRDNYNTYKERRTSQYSRFLDKSVDFVTYYSINKALSTSSINDHQVDSYIGTDSPVRYNKINNMPIYGFPPLTAMNSYDQDNAGFTNGDVSGTIIILQDILEPVEGDCFILNIFSELQFFRITDVRQIALWSKPYFECDFTVGIPDMLNQLNSQVAEEYNAIFDNIGTQDRVIISSTEYDMRKEYEKLYDEIMDYYISAFFNSTISLFNLKAYMPIRQDDINYNDKFLVMFMKRNRIIIFDELRKNSFTLDYNGSEDSDDFIDYKKTIYWAIENKRMDKFVNTKYIQCKKIVSPFTLLKGETRSEYFVADKFAVEVPPMEGNQFYIEYDFNDLWKKWISKDCKASDDVYDKVLALIVNYLRGNIMLPGYFIDLIGEMNPLQEFMFLPIILFIIRDNVKGLMTTKITI